MDKRNLVVLAAHRIKKFDQSRNKYIDRLQYRKSKPRRIL